MTDTGNTHPLTDIYRTIQTAEVAVFLFLIVPSMAFSFFIVRQGSVSFMITAASTILRDLALVALIFYFLWRNREALRALGLKLRSLWREILIGIVLFFPLFFGAQALEVFLLKHGFKTPSSPLPTFAITVGWGEIVTATVLVIVVAFSEEVIFRGYLLLRFQNLLKSPLLAVLLSSFIFSLGHGYEGTAGVVTVGFMGVAFASVYLWRQSLVAPMIMHFLQDFVSIVLVALLGAT